jgi:ABC-type branched-subunit amino acid transport system ATPase component
VRFGGVLAVNNVSFDVRRGEVFTLIGPNGAGKTTVFNLISRIYTPTAGEIRFKGQRSPTCRRTASPRWASRAPSRTSSCSSTRRCCRTCSSAATCTTAGGCGPRCCSCPP